MLFGIFLATETRVKKFFNLKGNKQTYLLDFFM